MQLAGVGLSPAVNAKAAEVPCKTPVSPLPLASKGDLSEGNVVLWCWLLLNAGPLATLTQTLPPASLSKGISINMGIFTSLREKHHPPLLYSEKKNISQFIASEAVIPYSTRYGSWMVLAGMVPTARGTQLCQCKLALPLLSTANQAAGEH